MLADGGAAFGNQAIPIGAPNWSAHHTRIRRHGRDALRPKPAHSQHGAVQQHRRGQ